MISPEQSTRQSPDDIIASLESPGAGLPRHHLLVTRGLIGPWVSWRMRWEDAERRFTSRDRAVRSAVAGLSATALEQRVLVPRLIGLEDSSRYWSLAMTCRHLEVVGTLISDAAARLARGEVVGQRVDFAAVKPVEVPASAVEEYFRFADGVLEKLRAGAGDRTGRGTVPHPWFGPLDATGWLWLLGFHTWVHVRQLRAIRAALSDGQGPQTPR